MGRFQVRLSVEDNGQSVAEKYQLLTIALVRVLRGARLEQIVTADFAETPHIEIVVEDPTLPVVPEGSVVVEFESVEP